MLRMKVILIPFSSIPHNHKVFLLSVEKKSAYCVIFFHCARHSSNDNFAVIMSNETRRKREREKKTVYSKSSFFLFVHSPTPSLNFISLLMTSERSIKLRKLSIFFYHNIFRAEHSMPNPRGDAVGDNPR